MSTNSEIHFPSPLASTPKTPRLQMNQRHPEGFEGARHQQAQMTPNGDLSGRISKALPQQGPRVLHR